MYDNILAKLTWRTVMTKIVPYLLLSYNS